jgi:hypothetical protein
LHDHSAPVLGDAARRAHDHVIRHDGSAPRCRIHVTSADRGVGHPCNRVDRTPRQGKGRVPAATDAGSSNRLIVVDGRENSAWEKVSTLCVLAAVAAAVLSGSSEMIHHR